MSAKPEVEIKLISHPDDWKGSSSQVDGLSMTRKIGSFCRILGIDVSGPASHKIEDDYYDDSQLTLASMGYSFRRRRKSGSMLVTVKREVVPGSTVSRLENEFSCDTEAFDRLISHPAEVANLLAESFGRTGLIGSLEPILSVANERTVVRLQTACGEYELSCDRYSYLSEYDLTRGAGVSRRSSELFIELEIEAKGPACDDPTIRSLAAIIACAFDLEYHDKSKFCRGLDWLRQGPRQRFPSS